MWTASGTATGSSAYADGTVAEGLYFDDEMNGHWVVRSADGDVAEGPMVDGERNGHWIRRSGSFIHEGPYVDGKRDGLWVTRMEGETVEVSTLYRDGERVRLGCLLSTHDELLHGNRAVRGGRDSFA